MCVFHYNLLQILLGTWRVLNNKFRLLKSPIQALISFREGINFRAATCDHPSDQSRHPTPPLPQSPACRSHFSFSWRDGENGPANSDRRVNQRKQWGWTRMQSEQAAVTKPESKAGEVTVTQWWRWHSGMLGGGGRGRSPGTPDQGAQPHAWMWEVGARWELLLWPTWLTPRLKPPECASFLQRS